MLVGSLVGWLVCVCLWMFVVPSIDSEIVASVASVAPTTNMAASKRMTGSPLSAPPVFLAGEKVIIHAPEALGVGSDTGKTLFEGGSLWVTNFRIFYRVYVCCHGQSDERHWT
jgi:hypothetical protein